MIRVLTVGEGLAIFRGDGVGSFAQSHTAIVSTGGAEHNVAIGLARLGVPCEWLGRVGDDSLGRRVARELRAEGVGTHAIVDDAAPTGLLLKETPESGRTVVTYHRAGSAGSRIAASDLSVLDIDSSSLLHLTGILPALSASAADCFDQALSSARRAGATISFDVNHRSRLWTAETASPSYRRGAMDADIVFGGPEELAMLVDVPRDVDDLALATAVATTWDVAEVVVKRGDRGAGALRDGEWQERGAVPVDVVDTVGAGDAFVAGYLAAWMTGSSTGACLELAVRTGAAVCTYPGDWEGALHRADLARSADDDPVRR